MPSNAITVVHKFIRNQLFQVSQDLFRAGPTDVAQVQRRIAEVAELLEGHAAHEEAMLAPALRSVAEGAAEHLLAEHHRLDADLARVRAAAKTIDAADPLCTDALLQLQLDWSLLVAAYLVHLDEEERTLFAPVAAQLPPVTVIAKHTAELDTAAANVFLDQLWQVVTPAEKDSIQQQLATV